MTRKKKDEKLIIPVNFLEHETQDDSGEPLLPGSSLEDVSGKASMDSTEADTVSDDMVPDVHPDSDDAGDETFAPPGTSEEENETACKTLLAEMTANWQRERADFRNFKRRIEDEKSTIRKYAVFNLALDIIRVLDYFESSVSFAENLPPEAENVVIGVKYTVDELKRVLGIHGVNQLEVAEGYCFDSGLMEATDRLQRDDVDPGTVLQVQRSGWILHDRVLRPAQVVVSVAPDDDNIKEGGEDD